MAEEEQRARLYTGSPRPTAQLRTIEELAEQLRKTVGAVRWLIYTGDAPRAAKIGGRLYFRQADIDAYIEQKFSEREAGHLSPNSAA